MQYPFFCYGHANAHSRLIYNNVGGLTCFSALRIPSTCIYILYAVRTQSNLNLQWQKVTLHVQRAWTRTDSAFNHTVAFFQELAYTKRKKKTRAQTNLTLMRWFHRFGNIILWVDIREREREMRKRYGESDEENTVWQQRKWRDCAALCVAKQAKKR